MAAGGQSITCPGSATVGDYTMECGANTTIVYTATEFSEYDEGQEYTRGTWQLSGFTITATFIDGHIETQTITMSQDKQTMTNTYQDPELGTVTRTFTRL
jgi:hypothetical protein